MNRRLIPCCSPDAVENSAGRNLPIESSIPESRGFQPHRASAGRSARPGARAGWSWVFAAFLLVIGARPVSAANPVPSQYFYVPFPEDQLLAGLQAIESGGSGSTPANPVTVYISIAPLANNTIIYYDQWENGYDGDIANPANLYSAVNLGGTQIWGDGDPSNGIPPGFATDVINAGSVIVLNNALNTTTLTAIDWDGRDKIAATKPVAVSKTGWATGPNTLLAGSVEVFDTSNWGTDFRSPVGQNIPDAQDFQMFEYTALLIMAGEGGATVQIDKDANGAFETTVTLAEGQGYHVHGGVNVGGHVVSDNPVQVHFLTGDVSSNYESRDSALLPTNLWRSDYYTPVSTANTGVGGTTGTSTTVWLYNPGTSDITVEYTTRNGSGTLTTTSLTVPGGTAGGYLKQVIPDGYGARFRNTSGQKFYAFSTTDSTNSTVSNNQYSGNQAWDWGFTLIPDDSLTSQVLVGLGIGRDPTSGSSPSENGNPVWVTPLGNGDNAVTVYVDFDANPTTGTLTDPNGNKYDVAYNLKELERAKVYDTGDRNQTGMLVYTLTSGVKLAAAWGQDPSVASAGAPGLDVGTGVPPQPLFAVGKNGTLDTDNDGDGFVSPGDVLLFTIDIHNVSRAPVPDLLLVDPLPVDTTYVANSTYYKNQNGVTNQIADNVSGTAYPLDGSGVVLNPATALPVGKSLTVTFKVLIDSFADLTPGASKILNTAFVTAVGLTSEASDTTPLYGRIGNQVWADTNYDGLLNNGESGINGVKVELYTSGQTPGSDTPVATTTTSGNGNYLFTGLPAGNYVVYIPTPPASASLSSPVTDTADNGEDDDDNGIQPGGTGTAVSSPIIALSGGEIDPTIDFGFVPTSSLAGIGNQVWADTNNDGLLNNGESGINGVKVELYTSGQIPGSDTPVATTTTSVDGNYGFSGLLPGNYVVYIPTPPAGSPLSSTLTDTNDNGEDNDDNGIQSGGSGAAVISPVIALGIGETDPTIDFGFVPATSLASIGNQVWADTNNDGLLNNGESGINGVKVELYTSGQTPGSDTPVATTTTSVDGNYSFSGLLPGNYVVYIPTPPVGAPMSSTTTDTADNGEDNDDNGIQSGGPGTAVISPVIALGIGETDNTIDFGFMPATSLASIGNQVWADTNNDGLLNNGESGINDVLVELYTADQAPGVDTPVATTKTSVDGNYSFSGLLPGNYVVYIPNPPLPLSSGTPDLNDNGEDNDNNGLQDNPGGSVRSPVITLSVGETDTTIDFGFYLPPPTAVELALFEINPGADGGLELLWVTLVEYNTLGYRLARTGQDGVTLDLFEGVLPAEGDGQRPQRYAFTDYGPWEGDSFTYHLIEVDLDGHEAIIADLEVLLE